MKKHFLSGIYIYVLIIGAIAIWLFLIYKPDDEYKTSLLDKVGSFMAPEKIRVITPTPNTLVSSPLIIKGEAKGTWFFEASFPIRLLDSTGEELGVVPAEATGEWMTENFVPFKATLNFREPGANTGLLILEKDNPSGLPEHSDSVSIPVRFK